MPLEAPVTTASGFASCSFPPSPDRLLTTKQYRFARSLSMWRVVSFTKGWNPQITQISVIKRRNCLPRRRVTSKPFARCTCDSTKCAARGSFLNLRNLRNLWILVFFQMTSLPRNERTSGRVAAYYRLGANRTKLLDLFCTGRNCNKWSPGGKTAHLRT